jgi:hypothetical protein
LIVPSWFIADTVTVLETPLALVNKAGVEDVRFTITEFDATPL